MKTDDLLIRADLWLTPGHETDPDSPTGRLIRDLTIEVIRLRKELRVEDESILEDKPHRNLGNVRAAKSALPTGKPSDGL